MAALPRFAGRKGESLPQGTRPPSVSPGAEPRCPTPLLSSGWSSASHRYSRPDPVQPGRRRPHIRSPVRPAEETCASSSSVCPDCALDFVSPGGAGRSFFLTFDITFYFGRFQTCVNIERMVKSYSNKLLSTCHLIQQLSTRGLSFLYAPPTSLSRCGELSGPTLHSVSYWCVY